MRALPWLAAGLIAAVIVVRAGPLTLIGVDAGCYASIARHFAERPLTDWLALQWADGQPFHEHPPLGLWLEALWFRLVGATAAAAVWWARLLAFALAAVTFFTARRLADERVASLSLLGLAALPSFLRESQNPMLELPLALFVALACLAVVRSSVLGFALAATAAVWTKGVVGFAVAVALPWAWWSGVPLRRVGLLGAAWAGLLLASFGWFEWRLHARGLPSFVTEYLGDQVLRAFRDGRHNHNADPFFFGRTLATWHAALLVALPVLAWRWSVLEPGRRKLAVLGLGLVVAFVGPLSLSAQKSEWYLNAILAGAAWAIGVALSTLPERWLRSAPWVVAAWLLGWCGWTAGAGPSQRSERQRAIDAVTVTPAALDGAAVSDCSVLAPWVAEHLFWFQWRARRVDCEAPAPWRFDGRALTSR